jgi:hypothetical protein
MYPNENTMDSIIPINEKIFRKKSAKKILVIKNKVKTSNRISNTWSEYFINLKAYAGTAFSFQWSLILS